MASHNLTKDEAAQAVEIVNECLRQGYAPPHIALRVPKAMNQVRKVFEATNHVPISRGGFEGRLRIARDTYGLVPDWTLWTGMPAVIAGNEDDGAAAGQPVAEIAAVPIPEPPPMVAPPAAVAAVEPPDMVDPEILIIERLRKTGGASHDELTDDFGLSGEEVLKLMDRLKTDGMNIHSMGDRWSIEKTMAPRVSGQVLQDDYVSRPDNTYVFGFVTDNHIGSKYARMDVLHDLYDRFAARGVDRVFNAGNWIDGEARFNKHDILVHGMDAQVRELAETYPMRPGIKTYAVSGDDHEGWYAQREGVNIGKYAENAMRAAGRDDWVDCGYMEADFRLVSATSGKVSILRNTHPGGGSAYAISYAMQKLVESYEGGDKPAVVLGGHYHKMNIMNYRNVWILQGGTTEDQTTFMRKKKLDAHVGGMIITLVQDPESGAIISCNDMYRYFNRGFYEDRGNRWSMSGPVTQVARSLGGV